MLRFGVLALVCAMFGGAAAYAQDVPPPSEADSDLFTGRPYSPYAQITYPQVPLWGDTHLHTALSMDAAMIGARLGLEDAYRFARGEEVLSNTGQPVRLSRPLDWLVIADHSDGMGMGRDMRTGNPRILSFPKAAEWHDALMEGGEAARVATMELITSFGAGTLPDGLLEQYSPGSPIYNSVWREVVETADRYNDPGRFTAIIGFEWTVQPNGNNLHRNILFRDGAEDAGQMEPFTAVPPVGSPDPLDLYRWMESYEATTGGDVLALAHNGNLSNGIMFPVDTQFTERAIDAYYVEQRAKWEPMYEITQIKGDGETHPLLSPDDAFADYETWDFANLDVTSPKQPEMLQYEYARQALRNGLLLERRFGTNPYRFGFVGSTDSHTGLAAVEENNFFGKIPPSEPSPERLEHIFMSTEVATIETWQETASGYAAVWALENTREAIFDAMERREVYATTGPRMTVRLFGGWDFTKDDIDNRQPAYLGYRKGVPMGGVMRPRTGDSAPSFMVYALRDPIGANLDRIQIVKGWLDAEGETHEHVYDVAWSDDRVQDMNGVLPPVGNTVDAASANWTNTIGASELATVWTDPDFDPEESAFYYARVLEIPTPRWVLYDAVRYGVEVPEGAVTVGQERAYTSAIWYQP